MFAQFINFISQPEEILERLRLVVGVAKQGGGVECAHHKHAVFLDKLSVLFRNLEIRADQPLCGNSSDADNDLRSHQPHLFPEPRYAGAADET